jgi:DNA-binding CsgD family transcriptional regulator/tetratricopeptide (TPR) repeat protein
VGRDGELATLRVVLAGPHAVVLVEGEAGIGKSRLLREYLATRGDGQGVALVAVCPPLARPQTLGPVAEAARQAAPGGVGDLGLSPLAGALCPLFPEWSAVLPAALEPAEDASATRYRLFRALAELLHGLKACLLAVEDAHWADEATLEFLLYLASQQPRPLSLVVTCRAEDVPEGSLLPRLSRLAAAAAGRHVSLGPLDADASARLVSSMLAGQPVSAEFAGFVHRQAEGVPLAVEELVRLMADRGALARDHTGWLRRPLGEITVPASIRTAVLERTARLGPDARAVLRAVAVLTAPAAEATVQSVAGLSNERLRAGLAEALASGLLAEEPRGLISFRHALACRAVYEEIPGPDRRALHQRAGEALEDRASSPAAAGQLARHFREAGDTGKWCRYAEQAADLALAAGDEATASALLCDLIMHAGLPGREAARLTGKATLLALSGDDQLPGLAAVLRAVAELPQPAADAAEVRFQLARVLLTMYDFDAARSELELALPHLAPGSRQAARAMMMLAWPLGSSIPATEHLRWLRRASAAGTELDSTSQLHLLVDRISALLVLGEPAGWTEVADLPREPATPEAAPQLARGVSNIGQMATLWGRYGEARQRLGQALAMADSRGYRRLRRSVLVARVHLDWLTGAWDGLAVRATALAGDEELLAMSRQEALLVSGLLAIATGDAPRGRILLENVLAEIHRRGVVEVCQEPAAALAWLALADGDVTAALAVTSEPISIVTRKGTWVWATDIAPVRVAALAAAGRAGEAAELASAFARGLRGRDAPAPEAGLMLCQAHLAQARGQHARAAATFARAATAWQALPRPYEALLARERQAGCLLAAGQKHAGLELLAGLRREFITLGATGDAERVVRVLREHEVAAKRRQRGYGEQLSPRELEAVRLVAQGRTDREIAQAMVLSPKTVARHLDSARHKLNAPSRTALAVAAITAGLVPGNAGEDSP